jgi:eukaryotic-like serine/threonine-protein kinase
MSTPAADRLVADRYALIAPLGRGGMGVVWRAQDAVLGREVAVKEVVFPPAMPEEERRPAQARVMREARAAARLNHPGAVTLYDVVQDQGGTFIVMELVNAPTLADLVREDGPLPVERVAEIGAQIAGALEAAHQAGIVHRDVKPGNVMVPANGIAKLADFGIASLQGDPQLTSTGLVIGSPAYMAPEQARGEESGPPVDFWALGATMFYAVEGAPPFDRGTSIATLAAVVNDPPREPRRAGPLAPLITALLSKDPGSRPSAPELRAELSRLAAVPHSPPTEVLPVQGPGRTVPLPAADPEADKVEDRPVPDGTQPDQAEVAGAGPGVAGPGGAAPAAAAAGLAAAGSEAAAPGQGEPADATPIPPPPGQPAGTPIPAPGDRSEAPGPAPGDRPQAPGPADPPATSGPAATPPATPDPPAAAPATGDRPAAPTDRAPGAPAFEPSRAAQDLSPGAGPAGPPRPLLPPAPVMDRGGRRRALALVALLVAVGLVAVLVAVNLRSGDDDPSAAPVTTAGGAATTGASETTQPATSTTGTSETTRAPTTTAASGLPEGWTAFTNRAGSNRVGVPPGFRARTRNSFNATVVEEEDDPRRVFTVRSTNPANPLPRASRDYRAWAARNLEDFREVSYKENQTYAGREGAVVFEYEADVDGRRAHVSHINLKGRTWGYNVEFIVPAEQWDDSQALARQFEQAFEPLG